MYNKKLLAVAVSAILASATQTYASTSDQQIEALLTQMNAHMQALQNQVNNLQGQVTNLKGQLRQAKQQQKVVYVTKAKIPGVTEAKVPSSANQTDITQPSPNVAETDAGHRQVSNEMPRSRKPIVAPTALQARAQSILNALYLGGTPVFSSPYIGIHSAFDGSDLLINASSVSLDARLLRQEQELQNQLKAEGIPYPQHPVLAISGKIEGQGVLANNSPGYTKSTIDLATAEIDTFIELNPYVAGFISFAYDNSQTTPQRIANSRVFLREGFATIGNFNTSPLYATLGQVYVPFGQFSSYLLTGPTTATLGQVVQRAFTLGFKPESGLFGAGYVFQGDVNVDNRFGGGLNLGYDLKRTNVEAKAAVGVINDIAESNGMQSNGIPAGLPNPFPFMGFGQSFTSENLQKAVPGLDVNGSVDFFKFTLIAEYVQATQAFSPLDLTYNGLGARPEAFHIEGVYHFNIDGRPSTFVVGYDTTQDVLALLIPKVRYSAALNVSVWRDTIATLEFRHDQNYPSDALASGSGGPTFGPLFNKANTLSFQFGIYF